MDVIINSKAHYKSMVAFTLPRTFNTLEKKSREKMAETIQNKSCCLIKHSLHSDL